MISGLDKARRVPSQRGGDRDPAGDDDSLLERHGPASAACRTWDAQGKILPGKGVDDPPDDPFDAGKSWSDMAQSKRS